MGGRHALVIGSQCESPSVLSVLPEAAKQVADALLDPAAGGCAPALPDGRALLLDPTMAELDGAITAAFERAAEDEATLFLSIIGHGEYRTDDFYLMAHDSPENPGSRQAFLLAQRVKELLNRCPTIDGLVLLLETCHAGTAAEQAGRHWLDIVGQAGRRFEVLTSSVDRAAADGCFSRSLADILRSGVAGLGDRLRCTDLKTAITGRCARGPLHLGYDGAGPRSAGDPGLWLSRNRAGRWQDSPLAGSPVLADVERLTEHYQPTEELGTVVSAALLGNRCVAVAGPPGAGKSSTIAALANPATAPDTVPPRFLHAVALPSPQDSPARVAEQLAEQLTSTVPGFAAAAQKVREMATERHWASVDDFTRRVGWPLHHAQGSPEARSVRIAVDLAVPARDASWNGLLSLAHERAPRGVQLIVAVRDPREVPFATAITLSAPTAAQEARYLIARDVPEDRRSGYLPDARAGWTHLVAWAEANRTEELPAGDASGGRVHGGINGFGGHRPAVAAPRNTDVPPQAEQATEGPPSAPAADQDDSPPHDRLLAELLDGDPVSLDERLTVLRPLAVLPPGSLLPIRLLAAVSAPLRLGQVRDVLSQLPGVVLRSRAGDPAERVGLAHPAVGHWLRKQGHLGEPGPVHEMLADAIGRLAPMSAHDRDVTEHGYAEIAEPEHLWLAGRHEDAVRSLDKRAAAVPVENQERWNRWSRRIAAELGPHHKLALRARARQATWMGAAGDPDSALVRLEAVFTECRNALGNDSDDTLQVWHDIAYWHADAGRTELSLTWSQALVDASTALRGPRAEPTLRARLQEARTIGQFGNHKHARELAQELVEDCRAELGADHQITRSALTSLADYLTGEEPASGDVQPTSSESQPT